MAGKGRPKVEEAREKTVTIRVTMNEFQTLKQYSDDHQRTITESVKEGIKMLYESGK